MNKNILERIILDSVDRNKPIFEMQSFGVSDFEIAEKYVELLENKNIVEKNGNFELTLAGKNRLRNIKNKNTNSNYDLISKSISSKIDIEDIFLP